MQFNLIPELFFHQKDADRELIEQKHEAIF